MNSFRFALICAWVFAAVCAVLCIAAHLRLDYTVIDDAFITYRYSARLALGEGLTYNDGERVLGTTTPGYALLMAGVGAIGGVNAIPVASRVLNMVFLLIAGGCSVMIARQFTRSPLMLAGIFGLFVLSPKTLVSSYSGMESAFFMALLCGGVLALLRGKWWIGASILGLLPIVRPEGAFVVGLIVLALGWMWWRQRINHRESEDTEKALTRNSLIRPSWRMLIVCALLLGLPIVIWGVVATLYYGSPLPHSIVAKQAGLYPIGIIGSFLSLLGGLTETYAMSPIMPNRMSRLPLLNIPFALLFLLILLVLLVFGGRRLARVHPLFIVMPLFVGMMLLFYATAQTLIFPQYYAFYEPLAKLCWWAGWAVVFGRFIKQKGLAWGTAAVIVFVPLFVLYPYNSVVTPTMDLHELEVATLRQPLYRSISQQLNPLIPDGTVVLTPEIGELGFYLDHAQILDSAGLVSPQTIAYLPIPVELQTRPGVIPPGLVQDYQPDLIVTLDVFIPPGMLETDWFTASYTPVIVWTYDWLPLDSQAFYVFSRNDFAAGMALQDMNLQMEAPSWVGER